MGQINVALFDKTCNRLYLNDPSIEILISWLIDFIGTVGEKILCSFVGFIDLENFVGTGERGGEREKEKEFENVVW